MIHIFIVNPYAGQKVFTNILRAKLSEIENLKYFIFNTKCAGDESSLVKRIQHIFQDEKLRFYCCGGSGTMRNMLNGFDDLNNIEIAFYPCGLTNDFLKVFGSYEEKFHSIENLIYGDVILVDYIKTNHGVALNTFSVGLDTNFMAKLDQYRIASPFNKQVPYVLALLYSIFASKPNEYDIYIDGKKKNGIFSEIFLGNGNVLGGNLYMSENCSVTDGEVSYMLIGNYKGFSLLPTMRNLMTKNFKDRNKYSETGACKSIKICRKNNSVFHTNHDGELMPEKSEWTAEIVHKGLHFVVPKGVRP